MTQTLEYHALSELFPNLSDAEFEDLKNSIEKVGQQTPITLCEGKILDGRHRYRACLELGVAPTITDLPDSIDPKDLVIANNLRRRNITAAQKLGIYRSLYPKRAHGDQRGIRADTSPTQEQVATDLGMSRTTVKKYDVAAEYPDLKKQMDAGDLTVHQADLEVSKRKAKGTWRSGKDIPGILDAGDTTARWIKTWETRIGDNKLHHDAAQYIANKLNEQIERLIELRMKVEEFEDAS